MRVSVSGHGVGELLSKKDNFIEVLLHDNSRILVKEDKIRELKTKKEAIKISERDSVLKLDKKDTKNWRRTDLFYKQIISSNSFEKLCQMRNLLKNKEKLNSSEKEYLEKVNLFISQEIKYS